MGTCLLLMMDIYKEGETLLLKFLKKKCVMETIVQQNYRDKIISDIILVVIKSINFDESLDSY